MSTNEIKRSTSIFSSEELLKADSWDAILALVAEKTHAANAHDELGDGYDLLKDKNRLVGVPVLFVQWDIRVGDYENNGVKSEYVSAHVAVQTTRGLQRYIVNDGSTGMSQQLVDYSNRTGQFGGLYAPRGLRKSEYEYTDPATGKVTPAETFYIDSSSEAF